MFSSNQRKILLVTVPALFLLFCLYATWQAQNDFEVTGNLLWASAFLLIVAPIFYVIAFLCLPLGIFLLARSRQKNNKDVSHYGVILFVIGVVYMAMAAWANY